MKFTTISLFPEMIRQACSIGVVGQAIQRGDIKLETINPRQFALDNHHTVDDRPFGGTDGMVMLAETLHKSIELANPAPKTLIYLTPRGQPFTDRLAREMAKTSEWTFLCARYGGVDERLFQKYEPVELSLGDFVLSGGELAACSMIDAISRFLPGVLGNEKSPETDSFVDGLLEEPLFTRPRDWGGYQVPTILLSGDHAKIKAWQRNVRLIVTLVKRPDLLSKGGYKPNEILSALSAIEADLPALRLPDVTSIKSLILRLGQ